MIDIPISTKTFCGVCGWCNRVIWKVELIRVIKWSLVQVIVVSKFKFFSWLIGDFNQHSSFVTSVQTNYVHHPCHIRSILSRTHAKYGHVQFLSSLKDEMRFFSIYYQAKDRIFLICNQWGGICDAELFYKSINDIIFYLLPDLVHYLSWLRCGCHLYHQVVIVTYEWLIHCYDFSVHLVSLDDFSYPEVVLVLLFYVGIIELCRYITCPLLFYSLLRLISIFTGFLPWSYWLFKGSTEIFMFLTRSFCPLDITLRTLLPSLSHITVSHRDNLILNIIISFEYCTAHIWIFLY